jgi:hypothetical protein
MSRRRSPRRRAGLGSAEVVRVRSQAKDQARLLGAELKQARRYVREGRCGLAFDIVRSVIERVEKIRCYGGSTAAAGKAAHRLLGEFERGCVVKG